MAAFRADESKQSGYQEVEDYFTGRALDVSKEERAASRAALWEIAEELGPVISTYPSWHPLVTHHDERHPVTFPSDRCGYEGLDHTRCFVHGFISCPYGDGADKLIASVEALPHQDAATITAEKLDVKLYAINATPVLVKCDWRRRLSPHEPIPLSIAMPLMLEKEVPGWKWAQLAETWETMRSYLLGSPHGSRSSLFLSQDSGQAIKKMWEALIYSGMYGPIKVDHHPR